MTTIRLIRLPEVVALVGYSRASIYRLMNDGQFPAAVKLGARAIAWRSTDIDAWIASRLPAVGGASHV